MTTTNGNRDDRNPWKGRQHRVDQTRNDRTQHQSEHYRDQDDLHDGQCHGAGVHRQVLSGQPQGEQRGEDRGEQGGDRGHRYRQCDVALGEVGDDVGCRAARGAADQNHAGGQCWWQLQQHRDAQAQQRHDHVLRDDAQDHRQRLAHYQGEVRPGQRESHAEHDDHQQRIDQLGEAGEGFGGE